MGSVRGVGADGRAAVGRDVGRGCGARDDGRVVGWAVARLDAGAAAVVVVRGAPANATAEALTVGAPVARARVGEIAAGAARWLSGTDPAVVVATGRSGRAGTTVRAGVGESAGAPVDGAGDEVVADGRGAAVGAGSGEEGRARPTSASTPTPTATFPRVVPTSSRIPMTAIPSTNYAVRQRHYVGGRIRDRDWGRSERLARGLKAEAPPPGAGGGASARSGVGGGLALGRCLAPGGSVWGYDPRQIVKRAAPGRRRGEGTRRGRVRRVSGGRSAGAPAEASGPGPAGQSVGGPKMW